jgi:hypothetical protein
VWRTGGYYLETITNSKGESPSPRSRVPSSLKRIKYRYVPAVKSNDYYKTLLANLYITVSSSLKNPLKKPVEVFSSELREYTKAIEKNVALRLKMESTLTMPSNMINVFQALVIMTKLKENEYSVPLDARGDGIQARHIPIILKYIADEDRNSRNQGSMQVETIWGYEEPENGVELARAFEMADEFIDYSSTIQIFASTHSPAFYMKKTDVSTEIFYTIKKPDPEGTTFYNGKTNSVIGEKMGLMPLIAPFIAKQKEDYEHIKKLYTNCSLIDAPTIMVEGKTDKQYIELAIEALSPKLNELINTNKVRIVTKDDACGTTLLEEWAYAWIFSGNKSRLYILFDKDKAGLKAKQSIERNEIFRKKRSTALINLQHLEPSDAIIKLYNKGIHLPYEIEHLLSIDIWTGIKEKDYIEIRSYDELNTAFSTLLRREKSLDNVIEDAVEDISIRDTIVYCNPHKDKKDRILSYVKNKIQEGSSIELFNGFARTIQKLEDQFEI